MYRSRPSGNLDDDVLAFLSSIQHDRPILLYDIIGSEAHSIMLFETGQIGKDDLRKILSALESARQDNSLFKKSSYEDIHEALEAFVIEHAGIQAGGKMHTARSRNDQVVLDLRMKVRDDINNLCAALSDLIEGLIERAGESTHDILPMYTHLQQGQLGTFSHFLLSYASSLMRDMERLYLCYQRVNQSPLGACAIGGTSVPIDRKRTAVLLGFDSLVMNSIDATSSRDVFLEFSFALSIMATTISRIAEDLIIWSTAEFGYIELADRFSSSSSAMPQKKNPDPLELIRAKSSVITSYSVAMAGIIKALPSGYSRDLQDMKPLLFAASDNSLAVLKILNGIVRTVQINRERMRSVAESSYAIALDVAERLVVNYKIPFRTAHKLVGKLVAEAAHRKIKLLQLNPDDMSAILKGMKIDLSAEDLMKAVTSMTPEHSIRSRRSVGSPNSDEQLKMLKSISGTISNYRRGIQKRIKMVSGSFDSLSDLVRDYSKK